MDPFVALERARSEFERRLLLVTPKQWDLDTECPGWTVMDLVNHVVGGNRMAVRLLEGSSVEEALQAATAPPGDDPGNAFEATAEAQEHAFAAPGALERICHHPAGDVTGEQLLQFRIGDLSLHAWDLARAVGEDETLDADLVEQLWAQLSPAAPIIAESGYFGDGPSGTVGDDAPLQLRVLDLSGRRP